jgi:prophage antirepressor-like protein
VIEIDDQPWWVLSDICAALGLTSPHKVAERLDDDEKGRSLIPTPGGNQKMAIINESGLYAVILRSDKPNAQKFRRWVTSEVLPSIRKHGAYATYDTLDELLRSPKFAQTLINNLEKERAKYAVLENLATEMVPKVLYCDLILQSKSLVPVSLIAKDYGMSAARFNTLLHTIGMQYKISGTWLLYQKYADMGYTQTRTYYVGEKIAEMHTCWTQKGRLFLYEQLKGIGILPMIECHSDKRFPA